MQGLRPTIKQERHSYGYFSARYGLKPDSDHPDYMAGWNRGKAEYDADAPHRAAIEYYRRRRQVA